MSRSGNASAAASPGSRIRQAGLTGPAPALDPRSHIFRSDLADIALAGAVAAAHYAEPVLLSCGIPRAMMRGRPSASAMAVSELLWGETFRVFEISAGWAWGLSVHDGYVGYVAADALSTGEGESTHRVSSPQALVFDAPDIKSPLRATLPLGAMLVVQGTMGRFVELASGGFVHQLHVSPVADVASDPVEVARGLIGTPYLWGGRTRAGIDCSGLVQVALAACGIACPRDADQQRGKVGTAAETPKSGDLVFFPGHVGLMASDTDLLHANAFWMTTLIEPLADVIDRLRPDHPEPVLAVRRLTSA